MIQNAIAKSDLNSVLMGLPGPIILNKQLSLCVNRKTASCWLRAFISRSTQPCGSGSMKSGYVPAVEIGGVMRAGGVACSGKPGARFAPGDYIQGRLGWQTHPTITAGGTHKLDLSLGSLEDWIGPLGTTALTAWFGIQDVGALSADDFVLVSGAAGGVGQMAGQFAKLEGCRVVGVAGGPEVPLSNRWLPILRRYRLQGGSGSRYGGCLCISEGVDLFFDNVGGEILEAALASSTQRADRDVWATRRQRPMSYGITNTGLLIGKRARMQGFIVSDYNGRYDSAAMIEKLKSDELKRACTSWTAWRPRRMGIHAVLQPEYGKLGESR